jgi:hypothetical protein
MTLFQVFSVSILAVLFLREILEVHKDAVVHRVHWLRALIWLTAAVAIALPDAIQTLAESVGIHRGADLVFYLFVLAFLGVTFYFYARHVRTQRQFTQLVRYLAIQEAKRGGLEQ